jgi:uncharacterized lipoprotein YbaY
MAGTPVTVEGDIEFEDLTSPIDGATIHIRVEDVSRADAPAIRLVEQVISDVMLMGPGRVSVPFSMQVSLPDPNGQYSLRVHVDLRGNGLVEAGDYITTQSYPVSASAGSSRMLVQVRRV